MPNSASIRTELQVFVNGDPIDGLLQASITTNNCFSSDSYSLTFAMGPPPLGDITFWSTLSSAYVEVGVAGSSEPGSQSLITGMVDTVHINPILSIVSIDGRDLSSSLIDSYRQQDFVNQTASEVVSAVASYHGLSSDVAATSGSVGRYYGDGYTRLSLGQFSRLRSDWDLVVQLARENKFNVFMQGTTLFFQPSTSLIDIPVHVPLHRIKALRIEQALTGSSNVTARVQSWNSQDMTSYVSDAAGDPGSATSSTIQPFLFSASNFTSQQVSESAERYTTELNRLAVVLHIEMPWDLALCPRTVILIDQTNSPYDMAYQIENIERHYTTTSGSSQVIRAVAT